MPSEEHFRRDFWRDFRRDFRPDFRRDFRRDFRTVGVCGAISSICDRINGLMDGRGDADREKGSLASGVVDGMREEESAAAKSCGFGRRVARLGDDSSSLSVRRLYAADEACPRLGARRESYLAYLPHLISFSDFRAATRRDGRRRGRRDCQRQ